MRTKAALFIAALLCLILQAVSAAVRVPSLASQDFQTKSAATRQEICAECYEFESDSICNRSLQKNCIAGNLLWAAHYNAFGRASIVTPAPAANAPTINLALRLPGQYEDQETGLHYNYRRYYDPETGRYLTQDPIGLEGGINLFSYAQADPVNLTDPTGEIVPVVVAGAVCMASCMAATAAEDLITGECTTVGTSAKNCAIGCAMGGVGALAMKVGKWAKRAYDNLPCDINSFPADTLIHIQPPEENAQAAKAGNTQLKRIKDLEPGDKVLSFAEWKDAGSEKGQDQRLSYEPITDIFTSHKEQTHVFLLLDNGQKIQATQGHPFLTSEGWRDAVLLKKGGKLLIKNDADKADAVKAQMTQVAHFYEENQQLAGTDKTRSAIKNIVNAKDTLGYRTILEVRLERQIVPVFNIEVANAHTFFVGEEGLLVHNAKHHICTKYGAIGRRFDKILKDAGFKKGVEDPRNLVDVPGHFGPHPTAYHDKIMEGLKNAADKGTKAVENFLNRTATQAQTPGTQINNQLTQPRGRK